MLGRKGLSGQKIGGAGQKWGEDGSKMCGQLGFGWKMDGLQNRDVRSENSCCYSFYSAHDSPATGL